MNRQDSVFVVAGEQAGFSSKLVLKCDECGYCKSEMSSPRTEFSAQENVPFEVNPRMVLFSHEVGGSYSVLQKFSAVMGIPAMHLKTFQAHDKRVTGMSGCFLPVILSLSSFDSQALSFISVVR